MTRTAEFRFVARVRPDAKGRITLGKVAGSVSSYRVGVDAEGRVLLEPYVEIPAREQWLYENAEAYGTVRTGLEQSAKGETSSLGSFRKFTGRESKRRK